MKILLLILLSTACHAQKLDTIPCRIPVLDTSHYWNYYNKSGSLRWRNVTWDATLVPAGGSVTMQLYVEQRIQVLDGYDVRKQKVWATGDTTWETINNLNLLRKPIGAPYLIVWPFTIPVNGYKWPGQ